MSGLTLLDVIVWVLMLGFGALALWTHLSMRTARKDLSLVLKDRADLVDMVDGDDLTSARSRRYMRRVFVDEAQEGQHALAFIDLDNFKSVNDGYGHKAGDALLRAIADALVDGALPNETVFRIGGDEFGVYMRETDLDTATLRAETLRSILSSVTILVDNVDVRRTASVGVARIERGQDFVGALYYADEAQYAAKTAGGDSVRANAGETLRSMIARRTGPRAEDLERAISSDEVMYHVQPIFDTRVGQPIGVEALIRWQRSDGRLMMPHQFIDVLSSEANPRLRPPLARAKQVASVFTNSERNIFCSFNISSGFLDSSNAPGEHWVQELLSGLDPKRTVIEIVERAVIRDPDRTKELLGVLRARGVRVALDDFGTGFSNLERLQELDVDIVKIDRRFVHGGEGGKADTSILRALLDMSQEMGFDIIAEGVESQEQLDMLHDIGIWNAQGFFLGRPDSAEHWQSALGLGTDQPPPRFAAQ